MFKVAPLSSSLMLVSMFGFIVSAFFLNDPIVKSWAWAFLILFVIIFIASMISMSNAPLGSEDYLDRLAIHKSDHYVKNKKK